MTTIDDLADKRAELDVTLGDVASHLSNHHDLAESTLSTRLSEWERGDRDPTDEDLDALAASLEEIEAEQNFEPPECSNPECGTDSDFPRVETPDGPLCQVCYYTREVEPLGGGR